MRPEFFVDRSLGRHTVAGALRAAGWTVTTHYEVYGARDEVVPDVEWLELCADRGLVVLSKDRKLRYRPSEIAVIRRRRLKVFVLSRANAARVEAELARPGPFVCVVRSDGIARSFP